MFGSELTRANWREGGGKGAGLVRETGGGGQWPFWLSGAVISEHVLQFRPHRGGLILISTSAPKAQMPGDYPKDNTAFNHGESLKTRSLCLSDTVLAVKDCRGWDLIKLWIIGNVTFIVLFKGRIIFFQYVKKSGMKL